jgi:WD40 repeat protein
VTSFTFSPDSQRLASADADKTVRVWNLLNVNDRQVLSQRHDGYIVSLGFSTDGERLASVSLANSIRVLIWKWRHLSDKPFRIELPLPTALPEKCMLSITLSPDLSHLACNASDNRILTWDLNTPSKAPLSLSLPDHLVGGISSLAFSADSNQLASAGYGIRVWDLRNPTARPKDFQGGACSRTAAEVVAYKATAIAAENCPVTFSPDGLRIASGFAIWDLRNPAFPPEILTQDQVGINSLRFGPDGRRLATFSARDGGIQILDLWSGLADYLCTRVMRNMSISEWSQYVGPGIPYERTCPSLPPRRGIHE